MRLWYGFFFLPLAVSVLHTTILVSTDTPYGCSAINCNGTQLAANASMSLAGLTYSFWIVNSTQGGIVFDPPVSTVLLNKNVFCVKWNTSDLFQFEALVTVKYPNGSQYCTVRYDVHPQLQIPSPYSIMNDEHPTFERNLNDYINASSFAIGVRDFQGANRTVNRSSVSGYEVNLNKDTICAYFGYCGGLSNLNVAEAYIYADLVILSDPLVLSGANIHILARALTIKDQGYISAAGVALGGKPGEQQEGAPGVPGGAIEIVIASPIDVSNSTRFRNGSALLIVDGGKGQQGGPAKPGVQGVSVPDLSPNIGAVHCQINCGGFSVPPATGCILIYKHYMGESHCKNDYTLAGGTGTCPTSGTSATPAGKSGRGGISGIITVHLVGNSTADPNCGWKLNVSSLVSVQGGLPGDAGPGAGGGAAGTPTSAKYCQCGWDSPKDCNWKPYLTETSCPNRPVWKDCGGYDPSCIGRSPCIPTVNGPSTDQLGPAGYPIGDKGIPGQWSCDASLNTSFWVTPILCEVVIQYVQDLYRGGSKVGISKAISVTQYYLNTLDEHSAKTGEAWVVGYMTVLQGFLHRVQSNLDIYGNPFTYVPLVSFETAALLYQKVVTMAAQTLYMCWRVEQWQHGKEVQIQNALDAANKYKEQVTKESDDLSTAQQTLSSIESDIVVLNEELQIINSRIIAKEAELRQQAQKDIEKEHELPFWEKALRFCSTVAKYIPVGQPFLAEGGAVAGAILGIVNSGKSPADIIGELPDAFDMYSKAKDANNVWDSIGDVISGVKSAMSAPDIKTLKDIVKNMSVPTKNIRNTIKDFSSLHSKYRAPKSEVDQLYNSLLASDGEVRDLQNRTHNLQNQMQELSNRQVVTMQKISDLGGQILLDLQHISELVSRAQAGEQELIDHITFRYIESMKQQAETRLQFYQYILMRSYDFRVGLPYPGNPYMVDIARDFIPIFEHPRTDDPVQELINLFQSNELGACMDQITNFLLSHQGEQRGFHGLQLTPSDLQELNTNGNFTLDLMKSMGFDSLRVFQRIQDVYVNFTYNKSYVHPPQAEGDRLDLILTTSQETILPADNRNMYEFFFATALQWAYRYNLLDPSSQQTSDYPNPGNSLVDILVNDSKAIQLVKDERPGLFTKYVLTTNHAVEPGKLKPIAMTPIVTSCTMNISYSYIPRTIKSCVLTVSSVLYDDFSDLGHNLLVVTYTNQTAKSAVMDYGVLVFTTDCGSLVTLAAEPLMSEYEFVGFAQSPEELLAGKYTSRANPQSNVLRLKVSDSDTNVNAYYRSLNATRA